jgi:hypothetical protein
MIPCTSLIRYNIKTLENPKKALTKPTLTTTITTKGKRHTILITILIEANLAGISFINIALIHIRPNLDLAFDNVYIIFATSRK